MCQAHASHTDSLLAAPHICLPFLFFPALFEVLGVEPRASHSHVSAVPQSMVACGRCGAHA
jgi:hypothetical protein